MVRVLTNAEWGEHWWTGWNLSPSIGNGEHWTSRLLLVSNSLTEELDSRSQPWINQVQRFWTASAVSRVAGPTSRATRLLTGLSAADPMFPSLCHVFFMICWDRGSSAPLRTIFLVWRGAELPRAICWMFFSWVHKCCYSTWWACSMSEYEPS
jgi:hypothetical protein